MRNRGPVAGTYVPGPRNDGTDWWKIVVRKEGRYFVDQWFFNDGATVMEGRISGYSIRQDVSNGHMMRVPKHLMVQEGL